MLNKVINVKYYLLICIFAIFVYISYQIFTPISDFPVDKVFEISKGENSQDIFFNLQEENYIRSSYWARALNRIFGYKKFYPGEYKFDKPLSLYQVLFTITKRPISYAVLIPEGFTKKQVAERLAVYVKNFKAEDFLKTAQEGYLFPDTYYFYSYSSSEEILKEFNDKFYTETFKKFGKTPSKSDVIIASMLEREARDANDMKIIAGIYYNRLKINMPLQVDATVLYGKGAWKSKVYYTDLKHDSDYNTYKNTGLPIGPISNPGINSLDAALNPIESDYLYYLTGKDGKMYYSKTFEEHVKNKFKYLK